jgi:hypothetical protein
MACHTSNREYFRWYETYAEDLTNLFSRVHDKYPTVKYTDFCYYVYQYSLPAYIPKRGKMMRPLKEV